MKVRLIVGTVIFSLLIAVVDQYFKTHLTITLSNSGSVLGLNVANGLIVILHIAVLAGGAALIAVKVPQLAWKLLGICMLIVSLSNLTDRMLLGGVVDYIYVLGIWFNLADTVITLGIILIAYKLIRN